MRQRQQAGSMQANKDTADLPPLALPDTKFVTTTPHGYLHPSVAQYKRIFLYHSHSESEAGSDTGRSITALFFLDGHNDEVEPEAAVTTDAEGRAMLPAARCAVWISNPRLGSNRLQQEARPPFKKLLKEVLASPEYQGQVGAALKDDMINEEL